MKRKITLSIDTDIYEALDNLPRKVSVSETVNWILRGLLEEIKAGRTLTREELRGFISKTPQGKDFLDRGDEHLAPKLQKIVDEIRDIQKKLGMKKKK